MTSRVGRSTRPSAIRRRFVGVEDQDGEFISVHIRSFADPDREHAHAFGVCFWTGHGVLVSLASGDHERDQRGQGGVDIDAGSNLRLEGGAS